MVNIPNLTNQILDHGKNSWLTQTCARGSWQFFVTGRSAADGGNRLTFPEGPPPRSSAAPDWSRFHSWPGPTGADNFGYPKVMEVLLCFITVLWLVKDDGWGLPYETQMNRKAGDLTNLTQVPKLPPTNDNAMKQSSRRDPSYESKLCAKLWYLVGILHKLP